MCLVSFDQLLFGRLGVGECAAGNHCTPISYSFRTGTTPSSPSQSCPAPCSHFVPSLPSFLRPERDPFDVVTGSFKNRTYTTFPHPTTPLSVVECMQCNLKWFQRTRVAYGDSDFLFATRVPAWQSNLERLKSEALGGSVWVESK